MQYRAISDPHGYGLVIVNDTYAPSDFEFAVRGDYPKTTEQTLEEVGKGLCTFCFPLSVAVVLALSYAVIQLP